MFLLQFYSVSVVLAYYEEIKNFMKIHAKIDPKSDPKIDLWATRDPTFEILGRFLRGLIFDEFSIGKKSVKNPTFGVRGSAKGDLRAVCVQGRRIGRGPSEVRSLQKSE